MKLHVYFIYIALFSLLSVDSYAEDNQQEIDLPIYQMLAQFDNAIKSSDVQNVAKYLSEDVLIVSNIQVAGTTQKVEATKSEYMEGVIMLWEKGKNYLYSRDNVVLTHFNEDKNKVAITSIVHASVIIEGMKVTSEVKEQAIVDSTSGIPLFTEIISHAKITVK